MQIYRAVLDYQLIFVFCTSVQFNFHFLMFTLLIDNYCGISCQIFIPFITPEESPPVLVSVSPGVAYNTLAPCMVTTFLINNYFIRHIIPGCLYISCDVYYICFPFYIFFFVPDRSRLASLRCDIPHSLRSFNSHNTMSSYRNLH